VEVVDCRVSGVSCRVQTVDCRVSLSVVFVGSCLSGVGCSWLLMGGVTFSNVGAQLWIKESMLCLGEKRLNEVLLEMMIIAASAHRKS
jgi:hypothetical protein